MNKIFVSVLMILFLSSCDPDVPGEGITLLTMEFGVKVFPDIAYIKLGDTVTIRASSTSTLSNGIKITDGKATIDLTLAHSNEVPVTTSSFKGALEGEQFDIEIIKGDVNINTSNKKIVEIYAVPMGDSISTEYKIIPLKTGTFILHTASKFFEGSQGKTRTQPHFDMPNHHFDELWQIPGDDYGPGDYTYDQNYLFAVYE